MSEYEFTIRGRIPSKKNSRINLRNGRSIPSKKYTEWHRNASEQLAFLTSENINKPIYIRYYFYLPDKRRTDMSNKIESINDLLVDIGFIEDDNTKIIQEMHVYYMGIDRESPRCNISVGYCQEFGG